MGVQDIRGNRDPDVSGTAGMRGSLWDEDFLGRRDNMQSGKYDMEWLSRNATSISDSEKKREAFREVCRRENADGSITIFYIDQYGQYRYEKK